MEVELGEGLVAPRTAVVAIAVGVHARGIEHEARAIGGTFGGQVVLAHAIAAHQRFGADTRRAFAVAGEHLDYAARVAAIQGGGRAAQYFDALGGVEVERGRLALAVRGAGGDAVGNQLDTAYAKGRTGAEATGGNLQVLRIVLAVLHHQAWHAGQRFGGVDAELTIADLFAADAVDRVGQVEGRAGAA